MCPLCSPVAGETETLTVTVHRRNKANEENLKQRSHTETVRGTDNSPYKETIMMFMLGEMLAAEGKRTKH